MSERFTVSIGRYDDPTMFIKDNQTNTKYDLTSLKDVEKLCFLINGINDVKKDNLERLKEVSKDNELLYDAVNGFMALLELQFEDKL